MAQNNRAKFEDPGHYTDKDRASMDESDFGDPSGKRYPIITQKDVHDAASLIGKAGADKERIKARIISIAKKKGFDIPDAWKSGGDSDDGRAASPEETRVVGDDLVETVFVAPITRVDPERRLVRVTATSESVDSFNTIFDYEASKKAFMEWPGNIREMHQPKAVGTRVGVHCDDEARKIDVTLRISKGAQDTWEKVLDGTLKGASIGASDVTWVNPASRNGERAVPRASNYRLVELSLVDNPSNPDAANITIMRNAVPDESILDLIRADSADDMEDSDGDHDADEDAAEEAAPFKGAAKPFKKGGKRSVVAEEARKDALPGNPKGEMVVIVDPNDPLASEDPDAYAAQMPEESLFEAAPEGDAEKLDPDLRDVEIDGDEPVSPGLGDGTETYDIGGPPPDDGDVVLAQPRKPGTDGSEVRREVRVGGNGAAGRAAALAAQAGATLPVTEGQEGINFLAPFGAGAPLPANRGKLPTAREMHNAAVREEQALEAEVRRAGDQAEYEARMRLGDWTPNMGIEYPVYAQRIALARGKAEKVVIERQQALRIAQELAANGGQPAVPTTTRDAWHRGGNLATAKPTAQALRAQMADGRATATATTQQQPEPATTRQRMAQQQLATQAPAPAAVVADPAPVAQRAMPPVAPAQVNSALVQTGPAANSPVAEKALMGAGRQAHSHNHAHNSALVHGADGAHSHEHMHLDGTVHSHPHMHEHNHHDHEEMRAAGLGSDVAMHSHPHQHPHDHQHTFRAGQPTDTRLLQAEATRAGRNSMELEKSPAPAPLASLHPVSGSDASQYQEKSKSPQLSVQNQNVGHMDLINTEDANAVQFGVPPEVIPNATPADGQVVPPAGFHDGGHSPAGGAGAGLNPANKDWVAGEAPHQTSHVDGAMDDDLDYDQDDDAKEREAAGARTDGLEGGVRSEVEPEETRVGARVSAESRGALHAARDQMQQSYSSLCQHCSCEECQAKLDAMAAASGAIGAKEAYGRADEADTTTLFGQQRLMQAVVARGLSDFQQSFQQTLSAAIVPVLSELTARFADLELTLADATRGTQLEVARSVAADVSSMEQRMQAVLAPLSQFGQQLNAVAEVASGLPAAVAQIGEQVEQIAAQPAMVVAPQQYAQIETQKRFAQAFQGNPAVSDWSEEQRTMMADALTAYSRGTTDPEKQMRAAQVAFQLGAKPKQLLGGR